MSTIQPPGKPPQGPIGPSASDPSHPVGGAGGVRTGSTVFQPAGPGTGVTRAGAPATGDPTQAILADLRAARITPDQAVQRLTDAAVTRTGCPPAARPAVEARMHTLLANDPLIGALLRQMGATVPTPDE